MITDDHSMEESEGYTQFLQTYDIQFNMDLDIEYPSNSDSKAEEEEEISPQGDPPGNAKNLPAQPHQPINFEMNDKVDLQPRYIHGLWTQLMSLARINLIDTNSTQ